MAIHDSYYSNTFRDVILFYKEDETPKQVEFVEESVPLTPGLTILDLGCGYGRHSIHLAKKGYCVTGYDLSTDFLDEAAKRARREGVQVEFIRRDQRLLQASEEFDIVLSLSTSLAFYDDQTNRDIFRRVHAALKSNGTFLFDQANVFAFTKMPSTGKTETKLLSDGRKYRYERRFDPGKCVVSHRSTIEDDGGKHESGWDLRYYTLPELALIAEESGFHIVKTFGDYDSSPYTVDSMRMIAVMKKS